MDMAKKIRDYRQLHGIKQQELADMLSVSLISISSWERGERNPGKSAIKKINKLICEEPLVSKLAPDQEIVLNIWDKLDPGEKADAIVLLKGLAMRSGNLEKETSDRADGQEIFDRTLSAYRKSIEKKSS